MKIGKVEQVKTFGTLPFKANAAGRRRKEKENGQKEKSLPVSAVQDGKRSHRPESGRERLQGEETRKAGMSVLVT